MVLASNSSTAHSAPRPDAARRATASCGLSFVVLFVLGTVVTTTGPLPNGSVESEAARMASEGGDVRLAGLFGLFATMSFTVFALGLALLAFHRRAAAPAVVSAGGGLVFGAVWIVSFAAVVASAQAAQTGLSPDATMAMGHLHSVSLLLGFAPAGAVLLSSAAAGLWGRTLSVAAVLVGAAAMTAPATLLSVDLDRGPLAALVGASFLGLPVWVTAAAITLLRRRSTTQAHAETPA